jgi:hypothetical protein
MKLTASSGTDLGMGQAGKVHGADAEGVVGVGVGDAKSGKAESRKEESSPSASFLDTVLCSHGTCLVLSSMVSAVMNPPFFGYTSSEKEADEAATSRRNGICCTLPEDKAVCCALPKEYPKELLDIEFQSQKVFPKSVSLPDFKGIEYTDDVPCLVLSFEEQTDNDSTVSPSFKDEEKEEDAGDEVVDAVGAGDEGVTCQSPGNKDEADIASKHAECYCDDMFLRQSSAGFVSVIQDIRDSTVRTSCDGEEKEDEGDEGVTCQSRGNGSVAEHSSIAYCHEIFLRQSSAGFVSVIQEIRDD